MTACPICDGPDPCSKSFCLACAEADARAAKLNGKAQTETLPPSPQVEDPKTAAGDLVTCPDILGRFGVDIESAGLVGETATAKLLYLAVTSRLFDRPASVAIKGVSSGGKAS
jgi:hypothetical protein